MRHTILAVDPGLRAVGVAVLAPNGVLRHIAVLTSSDGEDTPRRVRAITAHVAELLRLYRPHVVVLEEVWRTQNRSLAPVRRVADAIGRQARARRIAVVEIPAGTVRRQLLGYGRAGKRDVAGAVIARYPELRVYAGTRRTWRERHFEHLFDAVAVGLAYRETPPNSPSPSSRTRAVPCRRRAGAARNAQGSRRLSGEFTTDRHAT